MQTSYTNPTFEGQGGVYRPTGAGSGSESAYAETSRPPSRSSPTQATSEPKFQPSPSAGFGSALQSATREQFAEAVKRVQWMARPALMPGCPPGLEYLTQIDQLLVHQQVEVLELVLQWESSNRYQVKNSLGQQVYFAAEESDMCSRQCCGPNRSFILHITDNMGQEIIRVSREFKCFARCNCNCCVCGNCCAHEIQVEAPPGSVIGYIKQVCSCWIVRFHILDADRQPVLTIDGPCCVWQGICCTDDQDFMVRPVDGDEPIGKLTKQWSGLFKEMFTTADNFSVNFPMDLDVKLKAILLSGIFLLDFIYFENKDDRDDMY